MPTLYQMLSGGVTAEEHREQSMLNISKKRADAKTMPKPQLDIHSGLDLLGMTPGVGAGADLLNAALYAGKGDKSSSLLALSQALPLVGLYAGAKKLFKPVGQMTKASNNMDAFSKFVQNIKFYIEDNPGQISIKELKRDIASLGRKAQSFDNKSFYDELKSYSKEKFENLVEVPRTTFDKKGKWAGEPVKEVETLQERIREQEYQKIRAEEMPTKKVDQRQAGFAVTKRSELR